MAWPDLTEVARLMGEHDSVSWTKRMLHCNTNAEVLALEEEEKESLNKVRLAFFEATKDRNTKSACMVVTAYDLREMIQRWRLR